MRLPYYRGHLNLGDCHLNLGDCHLVLRHHQHLYLGDMQIRHQHHLVVAVPQNLV
jgi:hypothetical protein